MTAAGGQESKWDIVFLITGKPLPAMLDLAFFAQNSGMRTLMIILERGAADLIIDRALVNFEIVVIDVPYKTVDIRRLTSLPAIFLTLKGLIVGQLRGDGILVTSSYDLLFFGWLMSLGRRYSLRHQVRDLHALQLSKSPKSRVLVGIEKILLRRVDRLFVSSPEFATQYYAKIFSGRIILLENTPSKVTWSNFRKEPRRDGVFRVGFIGILRYKESLKQLVDAVQLLASEGVSVRVVFAGGGSVPELASWIRDSSLFDFLGPYEYTRDIKRLYGNLDLIYSVYDSHDLNCQIAMPNKFYESIISRIPIIVARNTFVEREVTRLGIGTSVWSGDVEGLAELLRHAAAGTGWYAAASQRLAVADASQYFDAYERALGESVSR